MTLISNSVSEIKDTEPGKKIEFCARTSYASQDKITEDSHIAFIQNLVRAGHTSTLEHENVVVECSSEIFSNYFAKFFAIDNFNTKFFNFTEKNGVTVFSSNIRGWFNFLYSIKVPTSYTMAAENILYKKYPYIFKYMKILHKLRTVLCSRWYKKSNCRIRCKRSQRICINRVYRHILIYKKINMLIRKL